MALGELKGWAVPTVVRGTDHTCVTSSEGHAWGCFGRNVGQRLLSVGEGEITLAACLSHERGEAGIRYAITGVCHQAANRILLPAGTTVSDARGYRVSSFMYGTYGKNLVTGRFYSPFHAPWPELQSCQAQTGLSSAR